MKHPAKFWIEHLQLEHHVEGGSFREVYRSPLKIATTNLPQGFNGARNFSTSIYFLLEKGQFSAFHKIASDELWHFYAGDALSIYEIDHAGEMIIHRLGNDPLKNEHFQCVIKAGNWFASRVDNGGDYALVGCTVSPGFDFDDFELANADTLSARYPRHEQLIRELTR
jgi:uncharacterized protein